MAPEIDRNAAKPPAVSQTSIDTTPHLLVVSMMERKHVIRLIVRQSPMQARWDPLPWHSGLNTMNTSRLDERNRQNSFKQTEHVLLSAAMLVFVTN